MVLFMDDTFKSMTSSGINIAKNTDLNGDGVNDIIEGARNGRTWNYGQLGGFTVDANRLLFDGTLVDRGWFH
jgi:hypothetical protein